MPNRERENTVNIHEAKTHLSRLLLRVQRGEEIIIAKAGRPIAKLTPLEPVLKARIPGSAKGKLSIGSDFDAPLPDEVIEPFYP